MMLHGDRRCLRLSFTWRWWRRISRIFWTNVTMKIFLEAYNSSRKFSWFHWHEFVELGKCCQTYFENTICGMNIAETDVFDWRTKAFNKLIGTEERFIITCEGENVAQKTLKINLIPLADSRFKIQFRWWCELLFQNYVNLSACLRCAK